MASQLNFSASQLNFFGLAAKYFELFSDTTTLSRHRWPTGTIGAQAPSAHRQRRHTGTFNLTSLFHHPILEPCTLTPLPRDREPNVGGQALRVHRFPRDPGNLALSPLFPETESPLSEDRHFECTVFPDLALSPPLPRDREPTVRGQALRVLEPDIWQICSSCSEQI